MRLKFLLIFLFVFTVKCQEESDNTFGQLRDVSSVTLYSVCHEQTLTDSRAYFSYLNNGPDFYNANSNFTINGSHLFKPVPIKSFLSGKHSLATFASISLPANTITFGWSVDGLVASIAGSNNALSCPNTTYLYLGFSQSPTITTLPTLFANYLNTSTNRFFVQTTDPVSGDSSAVLVAINPSNDSSDITSIFAGYTLQNNYTDIKSQIDTETSASSTIFIINTTLSTLKEEVFIPVVKKNEISAGTIAGIVNTCVFGATLLVLAATAVYLRCIRKNDNDFLVIYEGLEELPPTTTLISS